MQKRGERVDEHETRRSLVETRRGGATDRRRPTPLRPFLLCQLTVLAAATMGRVTAAGREIIGRWDARSSTVAVWARSAMKRCSAGGITLLAVPTRYQLGIVFHVGAPEG